MGEVLQSHYRRPVRPRKSCLAAMDTLHQQITIWHCMAVIVESARELYCPTDIGFCFKHITPIYFILCKIRIIQKAG